VEILGSLHVFWFYFDGTDSSNERNERVGHGVSHNFKVFFGNMGPFGVNVGLFYRNIMLICGNLGLFCRNIGENVGRFC